MRCAVLVLTCACGAALLAAQPPSPASATAPPRDSRPAPLRAPPASDARVFGRVIDAETSRPLRGAFVLAVRQRLPDGTRIAERHDTRPPAATRTDADGRFSLGELDPGEYAVIVRRSGYVQQQLGQASPSTPARQLVVGPGAVAGPLEFGLVRSAVISGRVLDANGYPADRVTVRAEQLRSVDGVSRLQAGSQATTNDLGEFRVFGLAPGRYVVSAIPPQASAPRATFAETPERELVPTFAPSATALHESQPIRVGPGDEAEAHIHLVEATVATVAGSVIDSAGKLVTEGFVGLQPREGWRVTQGTSTPVNGNGTFTILGVAPGAYTLTVSPRIDSGTREERATQLARSEVGMLDVDVSGDVRGLILRTQPGTTVRGRLVVEGDASQLRGRDVRVQATSISASRTWNPQARAQVRPDLTFELVGVRGPSVLRIGNAPAGWWTRAVRVGGVDATDGHDFGVARTVVDVELVVSTRPSGLRGRVVTSAGGPATDAVVIGFDDDARRWGRPVVANTFMVRPVEDGTWSIDMLRPGSYRLVAVPAATARGDDLGDPDYLRELLPRARVVSVPEGETPEAVIVMEVP